MSEAAFTQLSLEVPAAEPKPCSNEPRPRHLSRARLTLAQAARIMREAVKDKSYRSTPVGLEVAHFIR
jgi:hypothetical protein